MAVTIFGLRRRKQRHSGTGVPASWETAQSVAADLHRRLHRSLDRTRRTVDDARRCGVPTDHFDRLVGELAVTAHAIDDELVHAAELPVDVRHKALLEIRYQIRELERTGERIGRTAVDAASPLVGSVDEALRAINERLDHHIEARDELRRLGP